jgi:hypothetical protein
MFEIFHTLKIKHVKINTSGKGRQGLKTGAYHGQEVIIRGPRNSWG